MGPCASKIDFSSIDNHVFYTKNKFAMSIRVRNITFDQVLKIFYWKFEKQKTKNAQNKHFSKSQKNQYELVKK